MTTPPNLPETLAVATDKSGMPPPGAESDPSRDERVALQSLGAELIRRAQESQPAVEVAWDELMAKWGVHGQPVGILRLREMFKEDCASTPEEATLSRELIALREESRP